MKTLQQLKELIIDWANDRDLIKEENAPYQRLKLLEEIGETARAILKKDIPSTKDGIGDIFVVLVILAEQLNEVVEINFSNFEDDSDMDTFLLFREILHNERIYFTIGYLSDICKKLNYDLTECVNLAYNEIKERTGITKNGTFVKNETKS
jgi:NTP pyrophosphatase (non-canonical NTP hydrolase)